MKIKKFETSKDDFRAMLEELNYPAFAFGERFAQLKNIKTLFYKAVTVEEDSVKVKDVSYLNAIHAIYQHKDPMLEDEELEDED